MRPWTARTAPRSTSCQSGRRRGFRGVVPTWELSLQALPQELLRHLRVRGAPGFLHQLPHEEADHAVLAAAELLDDVGMLVDDLVCEGPERARIGYLLELQAVDDLWDRGAGREGVLQGLLRAGPGDRAAGDQADDIGDVLGREGPIRPGRVPEGRDVLRDPGGRRRRIGADSDGALEKDHGGP